MYEYLDFLHRTLTRGDSIGVATVTAAHSSAPRPVGASMLVDVDGRVHGSVSGGCVESAVFESLQEVLAGGTPRIDRYGISDDDAFAVGLTCGGIIEVLVDVLDPADEAVINKIRGAVESEHAVAMLTLIDAASTSQHLGQSLRRRAVVTADDVSFGAPWLTPAAVSHARDRLASGIGGMIDVDQVGESERRRLFVDVWRPRPRMIIFGSTQIAAELARQGSGLGYRVTVCDARATFATPARFPDAHEVVVDWPHRYLRAESEAGRIDPETVVCVLTHDAKFEVPLLRYVLAECAPDGAPGFIGAMGSRRTHHSRQSRLLDEGISIEQQAVLASPFGLDLGGDTPAETAVSMVAEIVAWRHGGTGRPLSTTSGEIHRRPSLAVRDSG